MNATTCNPISSQPHWRFHGGRLRKHFKPERSGTKVSGKPKTYRDEAKRFRLPFRDRVIQPQLATVARNGAHDGSPCTRFDPNHIHRRQRYSFFCLPGSNLRAWGQGHCVYRKPWAGPFGGWGVVHDQISPEGLKESSSVRHFAGVRGRFDCSSPGRLWVPSHQHKTDAVNKAPQCDRHSPSRNAFNGVRGPVRPVSGRVLPGSRPGRAGYAANEMCLPIFAGAINNTRAMNSQRGGGNRAAVGQRVLPNIATGHAGQGLRGSLLAKKILGGSFLPGGSSRIPARGARISNGNSFAHNKILWGVGRWVISKLHHFAEALTHGHGVSTDESRVLFSHPRARAVVN